MSSSLVYEFHFYKFFILLVEMIAHFNQVHSKLHVQSVHQIFYFICLMRYFGVLY